VACKKLPTVISPHGIAMPRGLYFTAVVFFFFLYFLMPNLWGHWTDLNQTSKLGHVFTYDCCLRNLIRTPLGINPSPQAGGKIRFLGERFWTLNISLQWNMIATTRKKVVNFQGLPYMPSNLVNFGPQTTENSWRVFAHPLNFCIGRQCQPYRMDVI